ncbi:MAG: hypothetical protein Q7S92_06910 [Candidatus Diapherotrites archaeon]|nr:hypothetical protein [Candidatus Diapherotrites archaeon]
MKGYAIEKVENGKLVKIKVDFDERINSIQILGDFFLHPEESIFEMEKQLKGIPSSQSQESIQLILENYLKTSHAKLIGMTAEAIARTVKKAMNEGVQK